MAIHRYLRILGLSATLTACGDGDSATEPIPPGSLPPDIALHAEAFQAYPDGSTVTCSFTIEVSWDSAASEAPQIRRYVGHMGGEASRKVLDPTGAGISLFADLAWPHSVARVFGVDSVELALSPAEPTSRFWDAFKALGGGKAQDGTWSGPWTCYPLDLNSGGWVDTALTAPGRWEITGPFVQRQ